MAFLLCGKSLAQQEHAASARPEPGLPAIILLKGPEPPVDSTLNGHAGDSAREKRIARLAREYEEVRLFNQVFADYPHVVVGGPEENVTFKEIDDALEKIGPSTLTCIIVDYHGSNLSWIDSSSATPLRKGLLRHTNTLFNLGTDNANVPRTADALFGYLGDKRRNDATLKDDTLVVVNTPCFAMSGLHAMTQLRKTTFVVTSAADKKTWDCDKETYEGFSQARYQKKGGYRLTRDNIVAEVLNRYAYHNDTVNNDLFVVETSDQKAEKLDIGNTPLPVGMFDGTVIDCTEVGEKLCSRSSLIEKAAALGDPEILPPDNILYLKRTLKNTRPASLTRMNDTARGIANNLAWNIGKTDKKYRQSIAGFMLNSRLVLLAGNIPVTYRSNSPLANHNADEILSKRKPSHEFIPASDFYYPDQ
ncbi:MAG: hypothetical protein JWM96_1337 [Alphaproteobacteria bacterium]|nr:hypothetical protein [Alphaproteobacteria bacterium]